MLPLYMLIVASLASTAVAQTNSSSCLLDANGEFSITISTCNDLAFRTAISEKITLALQAKKKCKSTWLLETKLLFQNSSITANDILTMCTLKQDAHAKANKVTMRDLFTGVFSESPSETSQDDYQFFLGGTERQANANNPTDDETNMLIESSDITKTKIVEWPATFQNFQQCSTQAVICCWADVPDSADNTDVCYVDNRAPYAGQVKGGFYMYPEESEGSVNCHGYTFGTEKLRGSYRFRGNALFQLAVTHGLLTNNFGNEVAGAPMCSCADDAPAIDKAACSEIKIDESYTFKWSRLSNPSLEHTFKSVGLETCKDTNGAEIGLKQHYETMVTNLAIKPTAVGRRPFNNTVVGDGNCKASLSTFLKSRSYII